MIFSINWKNLNIFQKLICDRNIIKLNIRVEDMPKTIFRTRYRHCKFLVMPFGLTNTPATFMYLMNEVFKNYLVKFVVVFIDDILIYSQTKEENAWHLRRMLEILRWKKLYAKFTKCEFWSEKMQYLGHVIEKDEISVDRAKVKVVMSWE